MIPILLFSLCYYLSSITILTDLFADDSTAIETGDSVDEAMFKMKNTAKKLDKYASKNSLTIHPNKCKIIIISKKTFYWSPATSQH